MKGFIPKFYRDGQPDGYKYLPAAAGGYQIGQALCVEGGKLGGANPSTGVRFISMYEGTAADGDVIPVVAVDCSTEFEIVLEAAVENLAPGVKCSVAAPGMSIQSVTTDGTGDMRVLDCTGSAAGDTVIVQFLM